MRCVRVDTSLLFLPLRRLSPALRALWLLFRHHNSRFSAQRSLRQLLLLLLLLKRSTGMSDPGLLVTAHAQHFNYAYSGGCGSTARPSRPASSSGRPSRPTVLPDRLAGQAVGRGSRPINLSTEQLQPDSFDSLRVSARDIKMTRTSKQAVRFNSIQFNSSPKKEALILLLHSNLISTYRSSTARAVLVLQFATTSSGAPSYFNIKKHLIHCRI